MVLTITITHLEYEDIKVKKRGGHNVPSMFPNNIDSRRICYNQNCCKRAVCRGETS